MTRAILLLAILLLPYLEVTGQGCSDAGFCTAGSLGSKEFTQTGPNSQLEFSLTIGDGERSSYMYIPQLEYSYTFKNKGYVEIKVPYYIVSGIEGRSGVGDPIITYSHPLKSSGTFLLEATAGARIGTGRADAVSQEGMPLPMPYQRSLGTTDFILGVKARWQYLSIATGYQQPVFQYNSNGYIAGQFPSAGPAYNQYFSSRELRRKADMLLSANGHYTSGKWSFSGGPLLIWHTGNDRWLDETGKEYAIVGSKGITLNLTAFVQYATPRFSISLAAGAPVVVRDVRPDGLTRSWIVTPSFAFKL